MKTRIILASITFGLLFWIACSEKEPSLTPQPRGGELSIKLSHEVNGKPIKLDKFLYQSEAGDSFQVTLLQYFLSNFEFHSPQTGWKKMNQYRLVRLNDSSTMNLNFTDLPFGNYDSIRFYVGLDSAANFDINRVNELDGGYGMVWTWNSGYIFYMFEGKFINENNMVLPFAYHIGGMDYLMTYALPIEEVKSLNVNQPKKEINIKVELDQLFRSPNLIELNKVALVSHTFDEPILTKKLSDNLLDAFSAK